MSDQEWKRPFQELDITQPLIFQQIEVEDYLGNGPHGEQSLIRMFGITEEGHSVLCHVHGGYPYLYVPAPSGFTFANIADFTSALDVINS